MAYKRLGRPKALREIVFEALQAQPATIDAVAESLFESRARVRLAMEALVAKRSIVCVGTSAGRHRVYAPAGPVALRLMTDPAAAWLFNEVML